MNITMLTYGSRGDVQPFLALAVGLQRSGHSVSLAAPSRFESFVLQQGVRFAPLAGDPAAISQALNDAGGNVYRMVRGMQKYLFSIAPEVVRGARLALQGADLLVHSYIFTGGAHSFAREMDIPDVSVQTFPTFAPTRAFPNVAMPGTYPGWVNLFSHWFANQIFRYGGNIMFQQLRRKSPDDFPARLHWPFSAVPDRPLTPLVFAYSQAVLPKPPDWTGTNIHVPGYFFLEEAGYQPPEALAGFLDAGPAPVCVTFGSMLNREAEQVMRAVMAGITSAGRRAVFLTGWGGWKPDNPPKEMLFLDSAPHEWLFPRCKTIIHHGGAGTTAAGLRAGVPNIVVPHAADQAFWGKRVADIGAGPQPLAVKDLTAGKIATALDAADADTFRAGAASAGRLIRAEDGVGAAVAIIEAHVVQYML